MWCYIVSYKKIDSSIIETFTVSANSAAEAIAGARAKLKDDVEIIGAKFDIVRFLLCFIVTLIVGWGIGIMINSML